MGAPGPDNSEPDYAFSRVWRLIYTDFWSVFTSEEHDCRLRKSDPFRRREIIFQLQLLFLISAAINIF